MATPSHPQGIEGPDMSLITVHWSSAWSWNPPGGIPYVKLDRALDCLDCPLKGNHSDEVVPVTLWSSDHRIIGSSDHQIIGSSDHQIIGSSDHRISLRWCHASHVVTIRLLDHRIITSLDHLINRSSDHLIIGSSDHRISLRRCRAGHDGIIGSDLIGFWKNQNTLTQECELQSN
jgi:hypothetical protein